MYNFYIFFIFKIGWWFLKKVLKLVFLDTEEDIFKLYIPITIDLSNDEIGALMDKIIELDIFRNDGNKLKSKKKSSFEIKQEVSQFLF